MRLHKFRGIAAIFCLLALVWVGVCGVVWSSDALVADEQETEQCELKIKFNSTIFAVALETDHKQIAFNKSNSTHFGHSTITPFATHGRGAWFAYYHSAVSPPAHS